MIDLAAPRPNFAIGPKTWVPMQVFAPVLAVLVALLAGVGMARAETAPTRAQADARIRIVAYRKYDVVAITATLGTSTMIVLGDSEKIETIAVGDSLSWKIEPNKRGNVIFLKPVEANTTTNMNVVSDKRIYAFVLHAKPDSNANQIYMVKFKYPDEDLDARLMNQARQLEAMPNRDSFRLGNTNLAYYFRGDTELKPVRAFDDGVKTWFRFQGDMPSIFVVEDGQREILANFRREGDLIVVDKVARQWMLRRGAYATCVFNMRGGSAPGGALAVQDASQAMAPAPPAVGK